MHAKLRVFVPRDETRLMTCIENSGLACQEGKDSVLGVL